MTEREMVITALECCKDVHQSGRWASGCISCGYSDKHRPDCFLRLADDAAELLKEQEEKQIPKQIIFSDDYEEYWGKEEICPTCGKHWMSAEIDTTHFCPGCGRAVKLDD